MRKEGWGEEGGRSEDEGQGVGVGGDSSGSSVTLEIRRLSSPLMMVEIVFQWGGGNARAQQFVLCSFKSFLCQVQVACFCPQEQPIVSKPQKAAQCWLIDGATQPDSSATANLTPQGILFRDFNEPHDNTWVRACPIAKFTCAQTKLQGRISRSSLKDVGCVSSCQATCSFVLESYRNVCSHYTQHTSRRLFKLEFCFL